MIRTLLVALLLLSCIDDYSVDVTSAKALKTLRSLPKKIETNTPLSEKDFNLIFQYTKKYSEIKENRPSAYSIAKLIVYSQEKNLVLAYMELTIRNPSQDVMMGYKYLRSHKSTLINGLKDRFNKEEQKLLN